MKEVAIFEDDPDSLFTFN